MTVVNHTLAGVAANFELGDGGPRWRDNGGVIEARDQADAVFINVRGLDAVGPNDFITLQQLNAAQLGLSWKEPVRAASTVDLNLASMPANVDGVALANGDRFLAKNQAAPIENGIYVFNGAGSAATRAPDMATGDDATNDAMFVSEGATQADFAFVETAEPAIVDTDPLTFTQFAGGGGTPTWAAVLGTGANTGVNDPIIDDGQAIISNDSAVANGGSYTIRGGNITGGAASINPGALLIHGGDSASSSNGSGGANVTVRGGNNTTATGAQGGTASLLGGTAGLGGAVIVQGGEANSGSGGGTALLAGGDNTDTGGGGDTTVRGGDALGTGSNPGGDVLVRGGDASGNVAVPGSVTIRGGQPLGAGGGVTGPIVITTLVPAGTNRDSGPITIETGASTSTSSSGGSGNLIIRTGDDANVGITGDITINTGDGNNNRTGSISMSTGEAQGGGSNDPSGNISITTGDRTGTNGANNSGTGSIAIACGTSSNNSGTNSGGGDFSAKGGDAPNNTGGSASLIAGFSTGGDADSLPGFVDLTTKVNPIGNTGATSDRARITMDTQGRDEFTGSDKRHIMRGRVIPDGAGVPVTETIMTLTGPTNTGENMKVRVFATAVNASAAADVLSHEIHQTFYNDGTATLQAVTANFDNDQQAGAWPGTSLLALTPNGTDVDIEGTGLGNDDSNWMIEVEWQIGGMAA